MTTITDLSDHKPSKPKAAGFGNRSSKMQFVMCFFGIFFAYLFYGIIQELVTKEKYGENKEKFTYTYCLVFFQCIFSALFSKAILSYHNEGVDTTPNLMYSMCSLTYIGAMLASNEALQHVSYPTQVVGKSIKPVPVMILGVLIARKRYRLVKYAGVLMIVLGIVLFMKKDKKVTAKPIDDPLPNHPYALLGFGEALLLISLAMDGLTGAIQDKMNATHKTKTHTMMFYMNIWSCLWLFTAVIVTGELFEFAVFAQKYPMVVFYLTILSILGCIGQHFIFTTITSFGPLTCSIITTTRKFFTILFSVFIFNNPMSLIQWAGVVMVFVGLGIDSKYGKEIKEPKQHN